MTEILTESFCERCGTRYTFESAAPRQRRMGGLKVLGRGLKNFVMSDDSSLDEAFAAARSDVERDATAQQLDAFHRTFNFCMSCRQYTCANCWNEVEARCLSCAPLAIPEAAPVLDDVDPERLRRMIGPAGALDTDQPAAAHVHAPEMIGAEVGAAEEAVVDASTVEVPSAPTPSQAPEPEVAAPAALAPAAPAPAPIGGLGAGQTIDDAVAAYEASLVAESESPTAEVVAPSSMTVEPAAEPISVEAAHVPEATPAEAAVGEAASEPARPVELPAREAAPPTPISAAPEPDVAAAAAPDVAGPEPVEPVAPDVAAAGSPGVDIIAQPVWPVAPPPTSAPAEPDPATAPQAPAWPTGPRWPTAIPARPSAATPPPEPVADPLAALMSRSSTDAMWAASSRDVLQPVAAVQATAAVQPCVNCGISLSATARFCRRCGTAQTAQG